MGALTIEEAIKKVTKKGLEKYRRAIPLAVALTKDGDTCVMPEIRYHLWLLLIFIVETDGFIIQLCFAN